MYLVYVLLAVKRSRGVELNLSLSQLINHWFRTELNSIQQVHGNRGVNLITIRDGTRARNVQPFLLAFLPPPWLPTTLARRISTAPLQKEISPTRAFPNTM